MKDTYGFIENQKRGDIGVFDGVKYVPSSSGANTPVRIVGPGAAVVDGAGLFSQESGDGRRITVYDGSATSPLTGQQKPTVKITREITTDDSGPGLTSAIDYGAVAVYVNSHAGGGAEANGILSFIYQSAATDSATFLAQIINNAMFGSLYGYYANNSINAHTCTITNASPAVVTIVAHQMTPNMELHFATTGALPSGITASTNTAVTRYWVKTVLTANTFTISASPGGAAINTSTNGSGTHYASGNHIATVNPLHINSSHVPYVYTGSGNNSMSNIQLQTIDNTALAGMGIWFSGDGTGVQWSEGIVVDALSIANKTFYDLSTSDISIEIAGDHATAAIRILNDNSSHYGQRWRRITAPAVEYGLIIGGGGELRIDEPGVAVKMQIATGTPGANKTSLYIQEGAGPTLRQVTTFDPGAAGVNFTAGQLVMVAV